MLDWTLLRSFLAVVDSGSLSAAADRLGLVQPTVGRHIRELEETLDTPLFRRQPRGQARPRPAPLPPRLTDAEISAHAELIARMGDKAIWLRYRSNG